MHFFPPEARDTEAHSRMTVLRGNQPMQWCPHLKYSLVPLNKSPTKKSNEFKYRSPGAVSPFSRFYRADFFLRPCLSGIKAKTALGCTGKEVLIGNGNHVKDDPVIAPPSTGVASSIDGDSLSAIKLSPTS